MLRVQDQKVPLTADREGVLYVGDSRVSLHSVVGMFEEGASAEEIALQYDSLRLPDIYAVIAYYLSHKEEINAHFAEEERRSEEACREYEQQFPKSLREKLLTRGNAPRGG
jgi:uncharacterized protein (DUF433 family)